MPNDLTRLAKTPSMTEIAGRNTDPRFYAAISILPNPDPILRKAGKTDEVFDAIQSDAHVIGELRAIKADFLRFQHKIVPGDDTPQASAAFELCQKVLDAAPAAYTRWPDIFWSIAQSTFRGISVHEIVWQKQGQFFVPQAIKDRPTRRFIFNGEGDLRVLTREQLMLGLPIDPLYFLVDRHMPSYDNPYGVPLFSSCFWPYTFKHAGFRWFVKFCERFGIPMPKGTYPAGASEESKKALENALENLLEAGYAALEEGSDITLVEAGRTSAAGLPQSDLINACNRELSTALSSQTLATDTGKAAGSRAAAQTHQQRATDVNEGDRDRIICTLNGLWSLITQLNFGPNVPPPQSHFEGDTEADLQRAQMYGVAATIGLGPSRKAMGAELGIQLADPDDPDDALKPPANPPKPPPGVTFAAAAPLPADVAMADKLGNATQPQIDAWVKQIAALVSSAHSLPELRSMIVAAYPELPVDKLGNVMTVAFQAAQAAGMYDVALERHG